jgi:predicted phage baseplate assembly protein
MTRTDGFVLLHLPHLELFEWENSKLYWIRARIQLSDRDRSKDTTSPEIGKVGAVSQGITVPARHVRVIQNEVLGVSDGTAGQRFQLKHRPVLTRVAIDESADDPHAITIRSHKQGEEVRIWQERRDFAQSDKNDTHFILDRITGEVRFGPAIRLPNGEFRQFGATPAQGSSLIVKEYLHGGGTHGNVPSEILNTLKTTIPMIERVHNRQAATKGLNGETLDAALMRGLQEWRTRQRAVTREDFEYLTFQSLRRRGIAASVKCLADDDNTRGTVRLLALRHVNDSSRFLSRKELELTTSEREQLEEDLKAHTLLTTRVKLLDFVVYRVSFRVRLSPSATLSSEEVVGRLHQFVNPGREGSEWILRDAIHISEIFKCLRGVPFESVDMYRADPDTGEPDGPEIPAYKVLRDEGIILSGKHDVTFA